MARGNHAKRFVFAVEVLVERMSGKERWTRSAPMSWSSARAEARRHRDMGRKARVIDLQERA